MITKQGFIKSAREAFPDQQQLNDEDLYKMALETYPEFRNDIYEEADKAGTSYIEPNEANQITRRQAYPNRVEELVDKAKAMFSPQEKVPTELDNKLVEYDNWKNDLLKQYPDNKLAKEISGLEKQELHPETIQTMVGSMVKSGEYRTEKKGFVETAIVEPLSSFLAGADRSTGNLFHAMDSYSKFIEEKTGGRIKSGGLFNDLSTLYNKNSSEWAKKGIPAGEGLISDVSKVIHEGAGSFAIDLPIISQLGLPVFSSIMGGAEAIDQDKNVLGGMAKGALRGKALSSVLRGTSALPKGYGEAAGGAVFGGLELAGQVDNAKSIVGKEDFRNHFVENNPDITKDAGIDDLNLMVDDAYNNYLEKDVDWGKDIDWASVVANTLIGVGMNYKPGRKTGKQFFADMKAKTANKTGKTYNAKLTKENLETIKKIFKGREDEVPAETLEWVKSLPKDVSLKKILKTGEVPTSLKNKLQFDLKKHLKSSTAPPKYIEPLTEANKIIFVDAMRGDVYEKKPRKMFWEEEGKTSKAPVQKTGLMLQGGKPNEQLIKQAESEIPDFEEWGKNRKFTPEEAEFVNSAEDPEAAAWELYQKDADQFVEEYVRKANEVQPVEQEPVKEKTYEEKFLEQQESYPDEMSEKDYEEQFLKQETYNEPQKEVVEPKKQLKKPAKEKVDQSEEKTYEEEFLEHQESYPDESTEEDYEKDFLKHETYGEPKEEIKEFKSESEKAVEVPKQEQKQTEPESTEPKLRIGEYVSYKSPDEFIANVDGVVENIVNDGDIVFVRNDKGNLIKTKKQQGTYTTHSKVLENKERKIKHGNSKLTDQQFREKHKSLIDQIKNKLDKAGLNYDDIIFTGSFVEKDESNDIDINIIGKPNDYIKSIYTGDTYENPLAGIRYNGLPINVIEVDEKPHTIGKGIRSIKPKKELTKPTNPLIGKFVQSGSTNGKVVSVDGNRATLESGSVVPIDQAPNWSVQDQAFEKKIETKPEELSDEWFEQNDKKIDKAAEDFKANKNLQLNHENGKPRVILHPSAKDPSKIQVSSFTEDGKPFGDMEFDNTDKGIKSAISEFQFQNNYESKPKKELVKPKPKKKISKPVEVGQIGSKTIIKTGDKWILKDKKGNVSPYSEDQYKKHLKGKERSKKALATRTENKHFIPQKAIRSGDMPAVEMIQGAGVSKKYTNPDGTSYFDQHYDQLSGFVIGTSPVNAKEVLNIKSDVYNYDELILSVSDSYIQKYGKPESFEEMLENALQEMTDHQDGLYNSETHLRLTEDELYQRDIDERLESMSTEEADKYLEELSKEENYEDLSTYGYVQELESEKEDQENTIYLLEEFETDESFVNEVELKQAEAYNDYLTKIDKSTKLMLEELNNEKSPTKNLSKQPDRSIKGTSEQVKKTESENRTPQDKKTVSTKITEVTGEIERLQEQYKKLTTKLNKIDDKIGKLSQKGLFGTNESDQNGLFGDERPELNKLRKKTSDEKDDIERKLSELTKKKENLEAVKDGESSGDLFEGKQPKKELNKPSVKQPYEMTKDAFINQEKQAMGKDWNDSLESSVEQEHYDSIEKFVKDGGKISQDVFDSLDELKQFHFTKHYRPSTDKGIAKQAEGKAEPTLDDQIKSLEKEIKDKYPVKLHLYYDKLTDTINLSKIEVTGERESGIGTKAMKDIIDFADANKMRIVLTPTKDFGANLSRLKQFYKNLGFVKNTDFAISETMVREPKPELQKELVKEELKPPYEMTEKEWFGVIDNGDVSHYATSYQHDWGTQKRQGKRSGGMIVGGMSNAPKGIKTYKDMGGNLDISKEDKIEFDYLEQWEKLRYLRAYNKWKNHDYAMLAAWGEYKNVELYAKKNGLISSETKKPEQKKESQKQPKKSTKKIEDFGEKLEGAAKDRQININDIKSKDDLSIKNIFPDIDFVEISKKSEDAAATLMIAKEGIKKIISKNRKYRIDYIKQRIKPLVDLTNRIIENDYVLEDVKRDSISDAVIQNQIELIKAVGFDVPASKTMQYKVANQDGKYFIVKGHFIKFTSDNKQACLNWLKDTLHEKNKRQTKYIIYSYRASKSKDTFIGVKRGKDYIDLKQFKSSADARTFLKENRDELDKILEKKKYTPNERRGYNRARVGIDHRKGKDVTPEMFQNAFGFRGVQFGNWVENKKRQQDLNDAYDALTDLAGILNVPTTAISLNGELGLAFGARGKGGENPAAAHYEPAKVVINLTKKSGAGSLAHEWFHALDNYFARQGGVKYSYASYDTKGLSIRPEIINAFDNIKSVLKNTKIYDRSHNLDKTRSKPYWEQDIEVAARTFEQYIIDRLESQGYENDYLANIVNSSEWISDLSKMLGDIKEDVKEETFPYLLQNEEKSVNKAFKNFVNTLKTKETDKGTMLYQKSSPFDPATDQWNKDAVSILMGNSQVKQVKYLTTDQFEDVLAKVSPENAKSNIGAFYNPSEKTIVVNKDKVKKDGIFHEFGHAQIDQIKQFDPKRYQQGIDLIKGTDYEINARANDYGDQSLDEGLVQAIGEQGAKIQDGVQKNKFIAWLKKLWFKFSAKMKKLFGRSVTLNEFTKAVAYDMRSKKINVETGGKIKTTKQLDMTKSSKFKNWFGKSKVTNPDGSPMVVYHGTKSPSFTEFKSTYNDGLLFFTPNEDFAYSWGANKNNDEKPYNVFQNDVNKYIEKTGLSEDAFWKKYYSNSKFAEKHSMIKTIKDSYTQEGVNIYPVYLSVQKVFNPEKIDQKILGEILGTQRAVDFRYSDAQDLKDAGYLFWENKKIVDMLKEHGYDGMLLKEYSGKNKRETMAVFSPTQIKSATSNTGAFSPTDPDIRFQRTLVRPKNMVIPERLRVKINEVESKMPPEGKLGDIKRMHERTILKNTIKDYTKGFKAGGQSKKVELKQIQDNIIQYARKYLPKQEITRGQISQLITKIKNAKNLDDIVKAHDKIDQIYDSVERKILTRKIKKLLVNTRVKKDSKGRTKGKLTPSIQAFVDKLNYAEKTGRKLDETEKEQALEVLESMMELDNNSVEEIKESVWSQAINDDLSDNAQKQLYFISLFTDLKGQSLENLHKAYTELKQLVNTGSTIRQAKAQAVKERQDQERDQIEKTIYGNKEYLVDMRPTDAGYKDKDKGIDGKIRKWRANLQSLETLLDIMSKNDKSTGAFESDINKIVMEKVWDSTEAHDKSSKETNTAIHEKLKEIYKSKSKTSLFKQMKRNRKKQLTGAYRIVNDTKHELELSQNEAGQYWLWYQDETLRPTFAKMGWNAETIEQLEDFLTPETKQFADWLINDFYQDYHDGINDVYKKLFHVDLNKNRYYSPVRRDVVSDSADDELLKTKSIHAPLQTGGIIARVNNLNELKITDMTDNLSHHVIEMEHFKAWAETIRDLRAILGNTKIRNAVTKTHGASTYTALIRQIDDFARGGADRSLNVSAVNNILNRYTKAKIGLRPTVLIKQVSSSLALIAELKTSDMMIHIPKSFVNYKQIYGEIIKSPHFKARYEKGHTRDIIMAQNKAADRRFSDTHSFSDVAMSPTKIGDAIGILTGGGAVYSYHYDKAIKNKSTDQQAKDIAIREFNKYMDRWQQSGNPKDLSTVQRSGTLGRFVTMFQNAIFGLWRQGTTGSRNLFAGRGSATSNIKRIAVAHALLPMLFYFFGNMFRYSKDMFYEPLYSLIGGIPELKDFVEFLQGKFYQQDFQVNPAFETANTARRSIGLTAKYISEGQLTTKQRLKLLDLTAQTVTNIAGVPYSGIKSVVKGNIDANRDKNNLVHPLRRLGYSKWNDNKGERDQTRILNNAIDNQIGVKKFIEELETYYIGQDESLSKQSKTKYKKKYLIYTNSKLMEKGKLVESLLKARNNDQRASLLYEFYQENPDKCLEFIRTGKNTLIMSDTIKKFNKLRKRN